MKRLFFLLAVLSTLFLTGCSTIMTGSTHKMNVTSNVKSAKVYVNGVYKGNAPAMLELQKANGPFAIKVEAPGYKPYTTIVERRVSEWVFGNIIVGGPVGLAIDYLTGGLYVYDVNTVHGQLTRTKVGQLKK